MPVTWVGASLGGMVGVVFAARHAERCAKLITISAGLRPDGWGTATRHLQRELVRDGLRNGDVTTGMMRARQLGMLTYRGRDELDTRFGKLLPHSIARRSPSISIITAAGSPSAFRSRRSCC